MKKTNKMICGILIATMILFAGISNAQAAEVPKWVPKENDVKDFTLAWDSSFSFKSLNLVKGEQSNVTYYSQLWYKNNSDNKVVALIGTGMLEMEEDFLSEELPDWVKAISQLNPNPKVREAETKWDLIVALLGGEATDEVEGFDRCIMYGRGGNYVLFGTVGKIMVMSFGLDVTEWASGLEVLGVILGALILAVIAAVVAIVGSLSVGSVIPTAGDDSTSKEDVVDFNSQIGKSLKMAQIDGYSFMIVFAVSMVSAALLIKKRYLKKIE